MMMMMTRITIINPFKQHKAGTSSIIPQCTVSQKFVR